MGHVLYRVTVNEEHVEAINIAAGHATAVLCCEMIPLGAYVEGLEHQGDTLDRITGMLLPFLAREKQDHISDTVKHLRQVQRIADLAPLPFWSETITVSSDKLDAVSQACEMLARLGMWQIELLLGYVPLEFGEASSVALESAKQYARAMRALHTGMTGVGCSYGIAQKEVPEICKIAFEIHQVIRHRMAWDALAREGKSEPVFPLVVYDEPIKLTNVPLIKVEPVTRDVRQGG